MSNKFFVMAVLCFGGIMHAMENAENSLQLIQKWQDVEPFAYKVVAYTADTYWFDCKAYKYALPSSDLSYAYIDKSSCEWSDLGMQYTLHQLFKKNVLLNTYSKHKYLANKTLAKGSLKMREITAQEAKAIIKILDLKQGSFFCVWRHQEEKSMSHLKLIAEQ